MRVCAMNIDDVVEFNKLFFFFFKQKTAYEMRISDWSSDVCSSDLSPQARILLDVNDSPLRRSQRKSVDDEKRLKFSLDGKQTFDHGPHDFVTAIQVPIPDFRESGKCIAGKLRSNEHTSELQSLMRISSTVFWWQKIKQQTQANNTTKY